MKSLLRTSIAARSAAIILGIVAIVGAGFLALVIVLRASQEQERQGARLEGLLDTVQDTVSIACFLGDDQLADQVAQGLLSNRIVSAVAIRSGGRLLTYRDRSGAAVEWATDPAASAPPGTLVRDVLSPFAPGQSVGSIAVVPDAEQIRRNVARESWLTALPLGAQILITGLGVVAVVVVLITRPIARISARLHELRVELGQKLEVPRGNEMDEIGRLVEDVNGMVDHLVRILTTERELRIQREIEERKYRAIFEHSDTGIFVLDEHGALTSYNPAFARLFALPESPPVPGALPSFAELIGENREAGRALLERRGREHGSVGLDIRLAGRDGEPARWINVLLSPVDDRSLQGVVNDVTERKRAEEAARELALTDPLTGLANRLGLERELDATIEAAGAGACPPTLLLIDLDRFKEVNDTYGHEAGDEVLASVARTLESSVRDSDRVARLGGDEFVVLLEATSRPEDVARVAEKIIAGIGRPIPVGRGHQARVGASIGAAVLDGSVGSRDELLRRADKAMYRAKAGGRNTYRMHGPADG